jgi:hypothetical protein
MHSMAMPIIRLVSSLHTPFSSIGSDFTPQEVSRGESPRGFIRPAVKTVYNPQYGGHYEQAMVDRMAESLMAWHGSMGANARRTSDANASGDYHEGMADVTAAFLTADPCLGLEFRGIGTGCIRNAVNSVRYPCSGEVQYCGQVISGAFWQTYLSMRQRYSGNPVFALQKVREWYLNSIRFGTADNPNDSICEAGVDHIVIRRIVCP